ncbi:MAG: zinc ABC transporter substrate-binding protein [Microgenomates group bacterium]
MSIKNAFTGFIFVGVFIVIAFFLNKNISNSKQFNSNKLKVATSFYPLAFLAEQIGGDKVIVTNLTPPGAEPHDFEPGTRDIVQLENQDIILLNGGGLEGYANKIKVNIDPKKTKLVIVGQPLMSDQNDPHVWLDPILYKKEAKIITETLIKIDPVNLKMYIANAQKISDMIDELDLEFKKKLSDCRQKNIVTSHKAFGYLASRYGLHEIALAGLSPEQEPSSKTLVEVATFAKIKKIRYIFFEELVSPSIAQTIAREIGAQTLIFSPLEGLTKEDVIAGKNYFTVQRANLMNLQIALACQ